MSPKSKKRKKDKKKTQKKRKGGRPLILLEYHQPIFHLLINSLPERGYRIGTPHPIRHSFWKVVPNGEYSPERARPIIMEYYNTIERELAKILGGHSIAYWLHIHRRLSPDPFMPGMVPTTVYHVRATLESAVQKYASAKLCDRIGFSNEVSEESILNGALMAPEFKSLRKTIKEQPQLVLTNFGIEQLIQFYDVEKLCFEIWRCAATLRIIGKGALLHVVDDPIAFYDGRSDELDKLVINYDNRKRPLAMSATGTVFPYNLEAPQGEGLILLPDYNVNRLPADRFSEVFTTLCGNKLPNGFQTNFIWGLFNIKEYFIAHEPFAKAFEETHGLPLIWVIAVIATLSYHVLEVWRRIGIIGILRFWQRAYEGPCTRGLIYEQLQNSLPIGVGIVGLDLDPRCVDVPSVVHFLELHERKRDNIDILLGEPHSIFMPVNEDRLFIDYAWIHRILYNLFYKVEVSDQNFKGLALEKLVHKGMSVLPTSPCKSQSGQSKQVDAAFEVGDYLVIVECRAKARSFGMEKGEPAALKERGNLVDKALADIDEKAVWLAQNPVGTNYNIRKYKGIIPIGVTPFVEFIPSLNSYYWLNKDLPRVLTPSELEEVLNDNSFKDSIGMLWNMVVIKPA
jgi:hypothetical protein